MNFLSSRENPLVKEYVRLVSSRGFRRQSGRFVLEGARLCGDALASGVRFERAFFSAAALEKHGDMIPLFSGAGAEIIGVSDPVAQKMADTQNPQGIFCTALMLDKALTLDKIDIDGAYAALENLQEPGNLGTVLRTAEALGFSGVLLSSGCADLFSPKVLRASMGAVFRLPFFETDDLPGLLSQLGRRGMKTIAAVADPQAESLLQAPLSGGIAAAFGNEGSGLTAECASACRQRVTIPMAGRAESLNAAAAAAILMWEISRNR